MRTALDAPVEALDGPEQAFVAKIREHGWFRTGVMADDGQLGFSFTTGFYVSTGQPELMIFSMKDTIAHQVFWDLYELAKAGQLPPRGVRTDEIFGNGAAYLFEVAKRHYPTHLGWSRWFHAGDDFPCLQIVWADRTGLFPWEAGFDPAFNGLQLDLSDRGWMAELAQ
ncbi:hypothetical protein ACVWYO_001234 [Sphingomonas sp. UYP23]